MKIFNFLLLVTTCSLFIACKKKTDDFSNISISDYQPLETGRYVTYRLDSLVYLSFGTRDTTISYEAKFEVDSLIRDNLDRPAYRIFRYLRKENTDPWIPSGTFMAVNTGKTLEFIENNLRFVKLQGPIMEGYSWKGNSFIDTYSINSELKYLDNWDYKYTAVEQPANVGDFNLEKTITVLQRDETIGDPEFGTYSEVNFSEEKYARGIGLVYRKFFHSEFQGDPAPGYYADGSYGITLTMIEHN